MDKKKIVNYTIKQIKNKVMSNNKNNNGKDQKTKHADTVIRNHILWAMGAGFIPAPIIDIFAVSALQMDMVKQLCNVYDIDFQETQGKAIVTSLTSSALARAGARSVIKLVPGVGTLIGGVTASIFNGASTYALGEVFKRHFEAGGTFLDFDTERLKKFYKEKFEKGKKVAEEMRKDEKAQKEAEEAASIRIEEEDVVAGEAVGDNISQNAIIDKLKELGELKENGIISEKEFDVMKKKLLDRF